ncbi:F-box/LRR-repeat protein 2-like isoform X6 [Periplaneta americana]|uniref:F-box/LRR-repeat protein 2-like isoform X6 n=2 Tax=Periplaneta americana TaxID=6978 RepID=UPI0037E76467
MPFIAAFNWIHTYLNKLYEGKFLEETFRTMASGKSFADLPDELLLEIFSNLNNEDLAMSVQHVNCHWREVSQDDALWKNRIFSPEFEMSDEEISRRLKNMPALRTLVLQRGTNTRILVRDLCRSCKDIVHLEFKCSHKISNAKLKCIVKNLPNIVNLSIPLPRQYHQLEFASFLGQFQKLTTLGFTDKYFHSVEDGVLKAIADGCPCLQNINLGSSNFSDEDMKYFLERKGPHLLSFTVRCDFSLSAHRLLCECSKLQHLCYDINYNDDIQRTDMALLSKLTMLQYLTLSSFREDQTRGIPSIFQKHSLPNLVALRIEYCDGLEPAALTNVLLNCSQIKSLRVNGFELNDDCFQHIGKCVNLEYLDISVCESITDKALEYIGAGCSRLQHLDVGNCYGLTDKGIEYICNGCQRLRYLNIQSCNNITDAVFEHIIKFKELNILKIMWIHDLKGTNFNLLPSHLCCLKEFYVEGCYALEEDFLDKLQAEMPLLKVIGRYCGDEHGEEFDIDLEEVSFVMNNFLS